MNEISTFKIRIDSITPTAIGFELFAGERVKDTYINILAKGGYGTSNRLILTPHQFTDFATRLIAYTYTTKSALSDEQLKVLWGLNLNIFDHEAQQLSGSLFNRERNRLYKLGLMKPKK
jgi:hypothetical protein